MRMVRLLIVALLFSLQSHTLFAQDIPNDVLTKIKARISSENPGNFYLQKMLVDAEVKSWLELQNNYTDIPDSVFTEIRDQKAKENPDQFYLQKMLVDADVKAWKELSR